MLVTLRSQRVNELCHGFMRSLNFLPHQKDCYTRSLFWLYRIEFRFYTMVKWLGNFEYSITRYQSN